MPDFCLDKASTWSCEGHAADSGSLMELRTFGRLFALGQVVPASQDKRDCLTDY